MDIWYFTIMPQNQVFNYESHFHFNDCDPAGIFYFGNVPNLCHRAYETWLNRIKKDWSFWFSNPEWIIPIKNCTVDYLSPMKAGEPFCLELSIAQISQSSFTTQYHAIHPQTKVSYFQAKIVHVFVDRNSFKKTNVPSSVRLLFESYLKEGSV